MSPSKPKNRPQNKPAKQATAFRGASPTKGDGRRGAGAVRTASGVNPGPSSGAVQAKTSKADRLRAWLAHHRSSAAGTAVTLLKAPLQTSMTTLVLAIALALPVTLLVALENVERLGGTWNAQPKVSVYLHTLAKPTAIDQLQQKIATMSIVSDVSYLSPEQALAAFQASSGMGDVLRALENNPLPPTLIVTPSTLNASKEALQTLVSELSASPIVEAVDLDMDWIQKLQQIMALAQKIVSGLAGLLTLGVLLVIGNTIRLAIENRREEIVVAKLVGATDAFVRRPFLYLGMWYGLLGAVIACLAIGFALSHLADAVSNLAQAYGSDFAMSGLGIEGTACLILAGILMGWVGAWLAVGRHLADIEPV